MGLSKELLDALNWAQAECITAARNLDGADADGKICEAFAKLGREIVAEPSRRWLTLWRDAVSKGETTQGYEQWRAEQVNARNGGQP